MKKKRFMWMKIQITQFSNFSRKVIVTAIFWHDRGKIMQSTSPIGQLCFENKIKRGCHSPLAPSKSSSGCDCKIFKTPLASKSLDVFVFGHLCISLWVTPTLPVIPVTWKKLADRLTVASTENQLYVVYQGYQMYKIDTIADLFIWYNIYLHMALCS